MPEGNSRTDNMSPFAKEMRRMRQVSKAISDLTLPAKKRVLEYLANSVKEEEERFGAQGKPAPEYAEDRAIPLFGL